jgi:hypothetical protein
MGLREEQRKPQQLRSKLDYTVAWVSEQCAIDLWKDRHRNWEEGFTIQKNLDNNRTSV